MSLAWKSEGAPKRALCVARCSRGVEAWEGLCSINSNEQPARACVTGAEAGSVGRSRAYKSLKYKVSGSLSPCTGSLAGK